MESSRGSDSALLVGTVHICQGRDDAKRAYLSQNTGLSQIEAVFDLPMATH